MASDEALDTLIKELGVGNNINIVKLDFSKLDEPKQLYDMLKLQLADTSAKLHQIFSKHFKGYKASQTTLNEALVAHACCLYDETKIAELPKYMLMVSSRLTALLLAREIDSILVLLFSKDVKGSELEAQEVILTELKTDDELKHCVEFLEPFSNLVTALYAKEP